MALLLSCDNIEKSFGSRPIFRGLSIRFDDTERTGLIGPNGSGKSTLMKILAGVEQPDAGEIESRRQLRLGYLPQADAFPDGTTPLRVLVDAQHDSTHAHDEHEREVEAEVLLAKVGFERTDQAVESLSGGWRKRLAVARELIRRAADATFRDRAEGVNTDDIVMWFDEGGALQVTDDASSDAVLKGFQVVPGLVDVVNRVGLATKSDSPVAVGACELVLESLVARKKISRSDAGHYGRAAQEQRRRPNQDLFGGGMSA